MNRRRLLLLASFLAYFAALWVLWPSIWVYPLKIFVVFLHELSHGLAAVATGGTISHITLDPYQGGATYTRGGNAFLTLSAGYLGSLFWGLLILLVARRRPRWARTMLYVLAGIVLGTTILYVRSGFGVVFGFMFGAALLLSARKLPTAGVVGVLTALGLTSALYVVLDIRDDILTRPHVRSDAFMLGELTGVPTLAWGVFWAGVAVIACILTAYRLFRRA